MNNTLIPATLIDVPKPIMICPTCTRTIDDMEGICKKMASAVMKTVTFEESRDYRLYSTSGWYQTNQQNYPYEPSIQNTCKRQTYLWKIEEQRRLNPESIELQISVETLLDGRTHGEPFLTTSTIFVVMNKTASRAFRNAALRALNIRIIEYEKLQGPGTLTIDKNHSSEYNITLITLWRGMLYDTFMKNP